MNDNDDLDYLRTLSAKLMQVVLKGIAMRHKQKEYFKSRDRDDLVTARQLEAEFDRASREVLLVGQEDPVG